MKRFLSIVLIIGLIITGIMANVSTAYADFVPTKVRVDFFADYLRARHGTSADAFISFFSQNIDTGVWVVFWDSENEKLAIVQYGNTLTFNSVWYNGNGNDIFRLGDWTGSVYRPNAFCFSTKKDNGTYYFRTQTNFFGDYTATDYIVFPDAYSSRVYFCPGTRDTFNQDGIFSFINHDVQLGKDGITFFRRNLFGSLVALYQNVVFYKNDRLYFTFSDQDVFFDVFVGSADAELQITVEGSFMGESGDIEYGTGSFLYHESDFVRFPDIITYDGVTNISPNGLRAIDITALSNYSKLVGSRVYPDGYYEMGYFADNEIIISNIISTPVDPYDPLNDAILDLENRLSALENKPVPDYDLQGYIQFPDAPINGASYPSVYNFWVTPYGIALLDDNDSAVSLDVAPRSCLVIRNIEDWQSSYESYKLYHAQLISTLWGQADLVVIVENADYIDIVTDSAFDPIYLYTIESQVGGVNQTLYSSWYTAQFVDHKNAGVGHQCFGFFTQHYLDCVNNYILSDGFNMIENGLNKLGDLNKSGFQTVASAVGTVYSAVQVTNSHWVNFLRDFGTFSSDVTHKLENIILKFDLAIDKLNQIEYNTSKEEFEPWYVSLWDFLLEFLPSNANFVESLHALDTGIDTLTPIPYVTPPLLELDYEYSIE